MQFILNKLNQLKGKLIVKYTNSNNEGTTIVDREDIIVIDDKAYIRGTEDSVCIDSAQNFDKSEADKSLIT